MAKDALADIAAHCLSIDADELKRFWNEMAGEEREHCRFWRRLEPLAQDRLLPQIFDDPEKTRDELADLLKKTADLWEQFQRSPSIASAFTLAFRAEFFMLHRAFADFFHFAKTISEEKNPEDTYEVHINKFIEALGQYGQVTPELELLGETLQRLWHENRALARQSSLDSLTQVLNRRGFFDALKPLAHLAQRNQRHVAVLMSDIDDFKQVNDQHGHPAGDAVLRNVAQIMQHQTRASDLVGRYGGEEFIVCLSATKQEAVGATAERIRRTIEQETRDRIPVTISIGLAGALLGQKVEEEVESLIQKADERLYRAKANGKNQVVLDDS